MNQKLHKMKNIQKELIARIARYIMLHGSFVNNLGLLNGKMGFVIFFYHYAHYTGRMVYDDFAGELVDEIYDEIHGHYPCNFRDGLCGIAWGMEYIIQHRFVEADTNNVLENIDRMIQEWDVRKVFDVSLETGLLGVGHYVVSRYAGKTEMIQRIPKDYIADLLYSIRKANHLHSEKVTCCLECILAEQPISALNRDSLSALLPPARNYKSVVFTKKQALGIQNKGLAGMGLHLLLADNT